MKKVGVKGLNFKSIRARLVICFSIIILISSIAMGLISINNASNIITKEAEEALVAMAQQGARLTESRIETQKRTLEMIALNKDIQGMDWEVQQPILERQIQNTGFLDIGVAQTDGTVHYSDGSTAELGDRDYVKRALSGESNVSDLIVSRVTSDVVLMYAAPIERDGEIVGALVGRRDGAALTNITNDIGYGQTGYSYMINPEGTIVAHPDNEKVTNQFNPLEEAEADSNLTSLASLFEKILDEKTGVSDYSFEGKELYAGFAPIEDSNWIFVITANKNEVLDAIPTLQRAILLITGMILLISIVIIAIIGTSIAKPIILAVDHSRLIAKLDITRYLPEILLKKKDEVGDLARALQEIIISFREIIGEVNESSEQVAATSEELTATSQHSASASEEISRTIEDIASGASSQAHSTEEGSEKAKLLGELIDKDANHLKNLNSAANRVKEAVDDGLVEIENLTAKTQESNQASQEIFDVIIKTNDSSSKIGQASDVIASIAEQTNLLALNAAIEAARAGEAGKGFAVVADEIRKLAEQSSSSTKVIEEMVKDLQDNAQEAVKTIERVTTIVKEQTASVENSKDKYLLIDQAMKNAIEEMENLNASEKEMEKMKDEILDALQNLLSVAEENAAATQEVSASMEEQAASIEEVANSSEALSQLAQNLQSIIAKFKL